MSRWAPWSLQGEPLALRRYVAPGEVARHVPLPGPSAESRLARLRAVYAALAERKIGYAYEAPADEAGRQIIRPPDEVLWAPRHATCLDLALVLAGGCLTAGLHPAVVILAPPGGRGSLHALLLVRLDHDVEPAPANGAVWSTPPAGWLTSLQPQVHGRSPGKVLAIDPVGVAVSLGATRTRGLDVSFDEAVASGAHYLIGADDDAAWDWKVGVDIGAAWRDQDVKPLNAHPAAEPLRPPYRAPDTAESPLRLLRAEYELVGFQNRDELTVLRDFCHRTAAGDRTGLAVITGIGGCGKTRLALELAHRLRAEGWYAGTLPKGMAGVDWLADVVSPVLVVLDYADGRVTDATALLAALRARNGPPAVVLLTARALDGDWLATIVESLDSDAHPYRSEHIALPDTHPNPGDVYHRTVTALTTVAVQPPSLPRGIRWTTLDYVLLGWIAAQGSATLPTTRGELYDQALEHEQNYWATVYRDNIHDRQPRRARLRKAAACLSLVAAPEQRADSVLTAVADLRDDPRERHDVRDTLITCLRPAPGEGLALRPDPVGDHLLLRELGDDEELLLQTLKAGGEQGLIQALVTLVRAGQNDPDTAIRLITSMLDADISRWPTVMAIAAAQGGAAAASLEQLTSRADTPLPLDELSATLPFSPVGLYQLALIVDQRLLDAARVANTDQATIAELLLRLSARADNAGDRAGALTAISEATGHYRQLAQVNPAAYLPDLAGSLNNLSNRQSGTGDRAGALDSITEAVTLRRQLAQANPAAYLPDLAMSLNNLSNRQSETGDRPGALDSITEAVTHYRQLAQANPAAYLPNLATSLNNLSVQQSGTGDRAGALDSITEAVTIRRQLAQANPAAYLPDLAMSLNNLSVQQSETGDRAGALDSITEAVTHYRQLAQANPAAYLPNLATSLNNLSNQQSETGDRPGALDSITEAVTIRRQLAQANPAAYLPDLAMSLNNLSNQQSETGDRPGALDSITEAVTHYRQLALANPAAYLPNLAGSLNNLSNWLGDSDEGNAIPAAWQAAIEAMAHPAARAELRAAWARRLSASEEPSQAWEQLRQAAADAEQLSPDGQPPDRALIIVTMRARQAVRSLAQDLGRPATTNELPVWASAPIPDAHLKLVNDYGQAEDWPAAEAALNDQREILASPQFRTTLTALSGLYLTNPVPGQLLRLLDEIGESGIEATFTRRRVDHQRRALLTAWISTSTWTESLDFYRRHHTDLTTADTRAILASGDNDTVRQHLAILDLTGVMPAEQVYAIVTDPGPAEEAVFHAIEHADLTLLATVATAAASALQTRPTTWGLLWAVLLLAAEQPDSAYDVAHQLAEQASPLQRRAHTIRLRALRSHHPGLPGLDELVEIIDPEHATT